MNKITVVGIDIGFGTKAGGGGTGFAAAHLIAEPGDEQPELQLQYVTCLRPEAPGGRQHAQDLYVGSQDWLRCLDLAAQLRAALDQWQPRLLALEVPPGGAKGARAMRCMGLATGVVAAVVGEYLHRAGTFFCAQVITTAQAGKRQLAGNSNASKEEMVFAAVREWEADSVSGWPKTKDAQNNAADAVAAVLAARDSEAWARLVGELLQGER